MISWMSLSGLWLGPDFSIGRAAGGALLVAASAQAIRRLLLGREHAHRPLNGVLARRESGPGRAVWEVHAVSADIVPSQCQCAMGEGADLLNMSGHVGFRASHGQETPRIGSASFMG